MNPRDNTVKNLIYARDHGRREFPGNEVVHEAAQVAALPHKQAPSKLLITVHLSVRDQPLTSLLLLFFFISSGGLKK